MNCISDKEYLCKLHCIRLALEHLFKTDTNTTWFADCGRHILTDIFLFAEKVMFTINECILFCYNFNVYNNFNTNKMYCVF